MAVGWLPASPDPPSPRGLGKSPHFPKPLRQKRFPLTGLQLAIIKLMKTLIYASVFIFSTIGGYIPSLWHAGFFSVSGILGGIVGTAIGIWVAIKMKQNYDV